MELQGRYEEIRKNGLGLIAISYDPPNTLEAFAKARGITFPLLSDPDSAIIRRYGLLNEAADPSSRSYGIPHPGTFVVDRNGMVTARFFEDAYQERYTAAAILAAQGHYAGAPTVTARTSHLTLAASTSETSVAPGQRIALIVEIAPVRGMHLYAPGKHRYQVVRLVIDPQPWMRLYETRYPSPEIYHFKPLDERVEVYTKPFRLVRDVTILASRDAQKVLAAMATVTLTGALEYQACDDRLCYNPARVPVSFTLQMRRLERN